MKLTMFDFKGLPFMLRFVSFFRMYLPRYLRKKTRYICLYLKIFGRIMVGLCLPSHTPFLILYLLVTEIIMKGTFILKVRGLERRLHR